MSNPLKVLRTNTGFTQEEIAHITGIPVKTIRNWEQNIRKPSEWTMNLVIDRILREKNENLQIVDENSGVISFLSIKKKIEEVVNDYSVNRVYLFGSYAKGEASEKSDIDLFMESDLHGLEYYKLIEKLRVKLNKKVEVLSNLTIDTSSKIDYEIKSTGIMIYER